MTLIEVMATVWIMGAVVVAAGALFTMIRASQVEKTQTFLEIELRHFADAVRNQQYQACADANTYKHAYTPDASVRQTVTAVAFWQQPALGSGDMSDATFTDSVTLHNNTQDPASSWSNRNDCDASAGDTLVDDGVQKITVRIQDIESGASASTTVIKRATTCKGAGGTQCR